MKSIRNVIPALLIGCAVTTLATHAVAAQWTRDAAGPTLSVSVRDLDFSEPSHLPILYSRLQQAASDVCDISVREELLANRRVPAGWREQCVRSAIDGAVRSVNNERLTALHSRSGALVADQQ